MTRTPNLVRELRLRRCRTLILGIGLLVLSGPALADELEDIQGSVDALTEEIRRIKERMALPDTDEELESFSGLGPAASKVYGTSGGLSLGGYGEFHFAAPTQTEAPRTADFLRFITYVGYKFNDRVIMNTEIEYEHANTGRNPQGESGSVSVEFSYLDFLLHPSLNVRAGNLLVPVGYLNKLHEPPYFRGNSRPATESDLIPSTWRELGVGVHGQPLPRVAYEVYLFNGLDAAGFSSGGVRGGRQKGSKALWEDVAVSGRVDVEVAPGAVLGGAVWAGQADHGNIDGGDADVTTVIAEAHGQVRYEGLEVRALVATTSIGDAQELSADLSAGGDPVVVPEKQAGGYVEISYVLAREIGLPTGQSLRPWIRLETVERHREVPDGLAENPALNEDLVTVGVEYSPHPQVVLKADWTLEDNEADVDGENPFVVGAGFVF
jgi:hypothetical protein